MHEREISSSGFWLLASGFCILIFLAIAPTLTWLEFSNSPEALNVATAQEIRRSGNWLVPTLQGETRLAKPPLTAWLTAAAITDDTMQAISSTDSSRRDRGFVKLAWQTRWPALVAMCVLLLATAALGRSIGGPACGIAAMLVAGTSLMFLRFCRYNATDVHLAMWVAVGNAFLMRAALTEKPTDGHLWAFLWCIGAGGAVGFAMMSKGPVALVQTVLPILLWALLVRRRIRTAPIAVGVAAFLVVGLPWFIAVLLREPEALSIWWREVTREGARPNSPIRWHNYFSYLSFLPYMGPWWVFFIGGIVVAFRRRAQTDLLALSLLLVPVVVMSFARDHSARYLLPILPIAAVVTCIGVLQFTRAVPLASWHWILLATMVIGFFAYADVSQKGGWYSSRMELTAGVVLALLFLAGIMCGVKWRLAGVLVGTVVIMLVLQAIFIHGYRSIWEGRAHLRPMAEDILNQFPDPQVFNAHPKGKRPPPELGVYLNRELKWIADPAALRPGPVPKVLLRINEPTAPPGWQLIDRWMRDNEFWWAFVLPPVTPSPTGRGPG